jgi:hypothetical protein
MSLYMYIYTYKNLSILFQCSQSVARREQEGRFSDYQLG